MIGWEAVLSLVFSTKHLILTPTEKILDFDFDFLAFFHIFRILFCFSKMMNKKFSFFVLILVDGYWFYESIWMVIDFIQSICIAWIIIIIYFFVILEI